MTTDRLIRVLLIDDDEHAFVLIRDVLAAARPFCFEVESAASAAVGLAKLREWRHDACLVDYRLPDGNGIDLMRRAKAQGCTVPLILITGDGSPDIDIAAMEAGAADFLDKAQLSPAVLSRAIRYAVRHVELLEKLRQLATHDDLTGLYSRRELLRLLEDEVGRCRRYGNAMAFVMADLDRFKQVNDSFGHQVGDAALRHAACLLQYVARQQDRIGRYGGDEIGILLPETRPDGAMAAADRMCTYVASHPFLLEQQGRPALSIPLSISVGVATFPEDGDGDRALIRAADEALLAAKRRSGEG